MSITDKFRGWFRTESFLRRESLKWAALNFPAANQQVARAVGYALVATLGVDFKQLAPSTDITADLGANEWAEWAEIQMGVEEELGCYFPPQPTFSGKTVAELVDFVVSFRQPRPTRMPKRGVLSSIGWCLP